MTFDRHYFKRRELVYARNLIHTGRSAAATAIFYIYIENLISHYGIADCLLSCESAAVSKRILKNESESF